MAGPLSSEEIEDVVSSVRRLVSNEQRPRTLSRDLNAERLLLTPAQRVMPETSPLAPLMLDASLQESQPVEAAATPSNPDATALPDSIVTPVVEDEDAATLVYVSDETDVEVSADSGMLPSVDPELAADVAEASTEEPEAEWEDEIWAEPGTVSLGEIALGAEEAEVLTGPEPDQEMLDAIATDDEAEPWAQVESPLADDEPIPFVPLRRRAEHLAARLAAGEVAETPPGEPEADVVPVAEETPAAPVTPKAIGANAGPGHVATEFVDADGMELAVLDEHALQEIVRQTLRAELQGELGERITRNVRKLVRAEINRALMARDLD
jgi:hypothetical protein